jgi:hypothetical protein
LIGWAYWRAASWVTLSSTKYHFYWTENFDEPSFEAPDDRTALSASFKTGGLSRCEFFRSTWKRAKFTKKVHRKSCIEGVLPPMTRLSVGGKGNDRWIRLCQKVVHMPDLMEERSSPSHRSPAISLWRVNTVSFPIIMPSRSVPTAFPRPPAPPNPDARFILAAPKAHARPSDVFLPLSSAEAEITRMSTFQGVRAIREVLPCCACFTWFCVSFRTGVSARSDP